MNQEDSDLIGMTRDQAEALQQRGNTEITIAAFPLIGGAVSLAGGVVLWISSACTATETDAPDLVPPCTTSDATRRAVGLTMIAVGAVALPVGLVLYFDGSSRRDEAGRYFLSVKPTAAGLPGLSASLTERF